MFNIFKIAVTIKFIAFTITIISYCQNIVWADKNNNQCLSPTTIFEKSSRRVFTESELFNENLLARRREYLTLSEQAYSYAEERYKALHHREYKGGPKKTRKGILKEYAKPDSLQILKEAGIGPGSKMLDLGSGTGYLALAIAYIFGADVTGIEYEEDSVEMANYYLEWFIEEGKLAEGKVRFINGDYTKFSDVGEYDILYYYGSGTDDAQSLEDLVLRYLKPGSCFVWYGYDKYTFDRLKVIYPYKEVYLDIIGIGPVLIGTIFMNEDAYQSQIKISV